MKTSPFSKIQSSYLFPVFNANNFQKLFAETACLAVEIKQKASYDAIAFTGMSGAAMAFPLSLSLGIPLICVRKNDGNHHSSPSWRKHDPSRYLEGCIDSNQYLIVDDFIDSGKTVNTICKKIFAYNPRAKCTGILLYKSADSHSDFFHVKNFGSVPIWKISE